MARKQPAQRFFLFFFLVLNLFYTLQRGSNGFIPEKAIRVVQSGGGGGSNIFGGGGVQMLIFPGGVRTPYPPSGSAHDLSFFVNTVDLSFMCHLRSMVDT